MKADKLCNWVLGSLISMAALTSCQSDEVNYIVDSYISDISLAKAPEFNAYSGSWNIAPTTRSSESDLVISSSRIWRDYDREYYLNLRAEVEKYLEEGRDNSERLDMDCLYHAEEDLTFEMLYLMGQTANRPSYLGIFYFDENGDLHKEMLWQSMNPNDNAKYEVVDDETGVTTVIQQVEGLSVSVKAGYKFGFFWEGRGSDRGRCEYYSISELNRHENYSKQAGTFDLEGTTFIGFEDWTDYDFQDWVFFVDPALKRVPASDKLPDFVETPGNDMEDVTSRPNEVEVNLALEDKEYLSSHLSLHVRHATDVEIFIPVPVQYYCDADDMAIVENKKNELVVHGGPYKTVYDIAGNSVVLNVEYLPDGIKIWTDGINQEIIDYCWENYGDGITFEVWNYFNEAITRDDLLYLLNQAEIRFLDCGPDSYINAFTENNGSKDPDDCTVSIVGDQAPDYSYGAEGPHNNGSDFNMIYDKK